jgi:Cys-tRNA(Pro) deacylase
MPVSDGYLEFVLDQLREAAPVRARRMFGGVGLYAGELFFALVFDDELFFKVDETSRPRSIAAGMRPWRGASNGDAMAKDDYPVTTGVRFLRAQGVAFRPRLYDYAAHGGAARAAAELGEDEHRVIKTLVMETDARQPLLVLMHGDRSVSTKQLARILGVRQVSPASEAHVAKYTGYQVGGVSPFGTRQPLPVYVEASILALDRILINGGKRGFLVEIDPQELVRTLGAQPVEVAIDET